MQKYSVKEGVMLKTEFVNNGDDNLSSIVYTDEQRVMQVVFSLQSNALKYTTKGEVKHIIEIK